MNSITADMSLAETGLLFEAGRAKVFFSQLLSFVELLVNSVTGRNFALFNDEVKWPHLYW